MTCPGEFHIALPSGREIVMTRRFAAPRAAVFEAWTQAEHVRHWWDPGGVPLASCEIDLRPGGSFRWVNRAHGAEHVFSGAYREITPPERLVFTTKILPSSPDALTTLMFAETDGMTTLTIRIECASPEDRDALLQMRVDAGTGRTLENLAIYLERKI